jgi:5-methylthioadenosine/S-adenosylhomocysteine deaminase
VSILIRDVLLDGKKTNIFVEGNRIREIGTKREAECVIDGRNKAAFPGFVNTHTHSAMTLLRGYADDMKLHDWLNKKIWPLEAKMDEDDVYLGSKLACLEMIKSGTTCFSDMYWHMKGTARAVEEMGLRAVLAESFIDLGKTELAEKMKKENKGFVKFVKEMKCERITPALGPHAVYTVSEDSLIWAKEYAEKEKLLLHLHLAETEKENDDCKKMNGRRPVPYLEKIGFLNKNLVAAHAIWFSKKEIATLAKHRVKISHNPSSNLKLASGIMHYAQMRKAGLTVSLGTDGCASNNNLDMMEEMRTAALVHKGFSMDPTIMPAKEALEMATFEGGKALGLQVGKIKEGMLADIILVDLQRPELCPGHNLVSDLVYAANSGCVDTTICNGKILMEERKVPGEDKILKEARALGADLRGRK